MHAYRDAIRDSDERRVVRYAAILYPGPETRYADGIEALSARPLDPRSFENRLRVVLTEALTDPRRFEGDYDGIGREILPISIGAKTSGSPTNVA
jgi:hypothetical protein